MNVSPSRKREWDLTQEAFDRLLVWLDPDHERAGKRYEVIRQRLMKIFISRGCASAEDLADETINRVTRRLQEIVGQYTGDPALYFYGVAQKVYLEYVKKKTARTLPTPCQPDELENIEHEHECLEQCLEQLTPRNRELIVGYYQGDKQLMILHRKGLAQRLGITLNALRLRADRIRTILQECVDACLKKTT